MIGGSGSERLLDAASLAAALSGTLVGDAGAPVGDVFVDTRARALSGDAGGLFVGLVGPNFDGGRFVKMAWDAGARVAIIERGRDVPPRSSSSIDVPLGCALVEVSDSLAALQTLARRARERYSGTLVAITGSNGKTTVKEMLRTALGVSHRVYASPMSWNSQVGVSLALLGIDQDAEFALIECGVSKPGEMSKLAAMVRPDVGVFVNVGAAHAATLPGAELRASEKAELFSMMPGALDARRDGLKERDVVGCVFVPVEEALARAALAKHGAPTLIVPESENVNVAGDTAVARVRYRGVGSAQNQAVELARGLVHESLGQDLRLAVAVALALGATEADVRAGLEGWRPPSMRLERSTTAEGVHVINDAYSADPLSARIALDALMHEPGEGRAFAVLGGLAQLGRSRVAMHKELGERCARVGVDVLVAVGEFAREIAEPAKDTTAYREGTLIVHELRDVASAGDLLATLLEPGDRVLLKGSRPERLERLMNVLIAPMAPARAYVDLDRLAENVRSLRALIGAGVGLMPVIKSFGYGLDSRRLAECYASAGVECLAVAYPDEARQLRRAGISAPILVLNVLADEVRKIAGGGFGAEVASVAQVEALSAAAVAAGTRLPLHLKIETGMGRSGASPNEAVAVADVIRARPGVYLEGVMTHLAGADEESHDVFTRGQIALFSEVVTMLRVEGHEPRWVHAANSAGALRFPEARYNMVRSGIALLGYHSPTVGQDGLWPILRLVSQVVSVKELPPEHSVGYGLTWRVGEAPRRIAVVAVGYNDGYPRHLSNRGWVSIGGYRADVVGNVCMDLTMVDVTDIPTPVQAGDEVVLYGTEPGEPSLTELASLAGTIAYELLTRISPRVRRVYQWAR